MNESIHAASAPKAVGSYPHARRVGLTMDDVIKCNVYLTDMARDFKTYNAIWAEHFPHPASAPCRTTLGIVALPTPIAIELKCIAALARTEAV